LNRIALTAAVALLALRCPRRRRTSSSSCDGPSDATQFDAAISRDGRRVLWVELRINVVFD
jgi:hypothetical protein